MSGLNYLETDCLPSHNGSKIKLKGVSLLLYFFVLTIYFQNCVRNLAKRSYIKNGNTPSEVISTHCIDRIESNLRHFAHFCKFSFECAKYIQEILKYVVVVSLVLHSLSCFKNEENFLVCNIYLFVLTTCFVYFHKFKFPATSKRI